MYRNGTVASSYRPVRSIISDLSIRLLNLKMEEFLSLVNMIKAVVKEYSTNKFTKDTYFDLVKECYRRISEIVFLFETALDDLSEVENINDRLLSSISKDARIVDNFVVDGILNDLENFLILIEGRLNSFEFPVGLQGIVMIDETISDHLLTQIFKNIQKR